jgi:hypothetical protein
MKSRLCKLKARVLRKLHSNLVRSASSSVLSPAFLQLVSLIVWNFKNKPEIPQLWSAGVHENIPQTFPS